MGMDTMGGHYLVSPTSNPPPHAPSHHGWEWDGHGKYLDHLEMGSSGPVSVLAPPGPMGHVLGTMGGMYLVLLSDSTTTWLT
jgi:hypothetical protein